MVTWMVTCMVTHVRVFGSCEASGETRVDIYGRVRMVLIVMCVWEIVVDDDVDSYAGWRLL